MPPSTGTSVAAPEYLTVGERDDRLRFAVVDGTAEVFGVDDPLDRGADGFLVVGVAADRHVRHRDLLGSNCGEGSGIRPA